MAQREEGSRDPWDEDRDFGAMGCMPSAAECGQSRGEAEGWPWGTGALRGLVRRRVQRARWEACRWEA